MIFHEMESMEEESILNFGVFERSNWLKPFWGCEDFIVTGPVDGNNPCLCLLPIIISFLESIKKLWEYICCDVHLPKPHQIWTWRPRQTRCSHHGKNSNTNWQMAHVVTT